MPYGGDGGSGGGGGGGRDSYVYGRSNKTKANKRANNKEQARRQRKKKKMNKFCFTKYLRGISGYNTDNKKQPIFI